MKKSCPPKVTISSLTEIGLNESTIPVLKQWSYTGRRVISSALADTSCADLGVHGVLEKFNMTLGTSYILGSSLFSILDSFVRDNRDFGTAYAYLRACDVYYDFPKFNIEDTLRHNEKEDRERRSGLIKDGMITLTEHASPQRLWDLYANRVVPFWVPDRGDKRMWAISHAWMDEKDRKDMWTPINGYEWPVPMPKDANLDLICIKMLNLGTEYVWLDVLCLRQMYAVREDHHEEDLRKDDLRKEEWKLDVPTIGFVYDNAKSRKNCRIVGYFSGLGRPLNFKLGDFESHRCWFNRAWTLQEIPSHESVFIIAGATGNNAMEKEVQRMFDERLRSLQHLLKFQSTLNIISEMRNRVSANPLDKIAGLVYLFQLLCAPLYDATHLEEDAWEVLVDSMESGARAELFFYYPGPGNRSKCWRPSWEQVMTHTPSWRNGWTRIGPLQISGTDSDYFIGPRIDSMYVHGLADTSDKPRQGSLFDRGMLHAAKIVANHAYLIPDGWYTLIGPMRPVAPASEWVRVNIWVVGRKRQDGKFEKVAVINIVDYEEMEWLWNQGQTRTDIHWDMTYLC
ncbi:hypothetical protein ARMSODRAFT_946132 [Armillaria solidipes]|uniref:Heterokaryon incompatibility domain-containing protein n=1 Tax=Armillaria solidipes TaxID=1076256 RepID=A0A2H3AII4_9AGAR|nr:hypothetical protein ARMSODRAFT_946132 [Armillaria solidipes]